MHPNANCNCRYADVGCDKMEEVMDQISGKWKMRILFMVGAHGTLRYGEVPPRVDYRLTPNGEALMPIFDDIQAYIRKNACSNCCGDKPAAPSGARHGCCE